MSTWQLKFAKISSGQSIFFTKKGTPCVNYTLLGQAKCQTTGKIFPHILHKNGSLRGHFCTSTSKVTHGLGGGVQGPKKKMKISPQPAPRPVLVTRQQFSWRKNINYSDF